MRMATSEGLLEESCLSRAIRPANCCYVEFAIHHPGSTCDQARGTSKEHGARQNHSSSFMRTKPSPTCCIKDYSRSNLCCGGEGLFSRFGGEQPIRIDVGQEVNEPQKLFIRHLDKA